MRNLLGGIQLPKRAVLWFSIIATVAFFALFSPGTSGICPGSRPDCIQSSFYFSIVILWAPLLLLFSAITYRREQKIYDAWVKFAIPWVLVSSIVTYLAPVSRSLHDPNWNGWAALLMTAFLCAVSSIIIWKRRKSI